MDNERKNECSEIGYRLNPFMKQSGIPIQKEKESVKNRCIEERVFHEWMVYEWEFESVNRKGLIRGYHPHWKTADKMICKFCLTIAYKKQ